MSAANHRRGRGREKTKASAVAERRAEAKPRPQDTPGPKTHRRGAAQALRPQVPADRSEELRRVSEELKQTTHRYSDLEAAHRTLGLSEMLYRGLFNSMAEGIALHEIISGSDGRPRDCRFLEVNPAFERLTGLKREDAVGRSVAEVLPADDPFWERIYGEAALLGTPVRFENRSEKLNRDYEVFVYRPGPGRIAVILMDVGERKRYERQLRDSREDLKRAQAVAHTGSWRLDLANKKINWSDEARRIFGVAPGTALGFETFLDRVHPDERHTVARKWQDALKNGGPYEVEHRIVVDGEVKWVRERAELEVAENGAVLGGFGTTQDITALKQAEEEIRLSHSRLETMVRERTAQLETAIRAMEIEIDERRKIQNRLQQLSRVFMDATDPIIIEDLSGRIVEANREAEAAYGWSRAELIGRPVADIIPPERRSGAEKLRQICRRGEEVRDWEGERQHRSGKTISTLMAAFPLLNASGEVTAVITMAKDITARKQMEARLTESRRRLQEISHRTVQALETDRRYVSRELHDSIGGNLAALKFILEESLDQTGEDSPAHASLLKAVLFLTQTIKESKRIAANLRPLTLDDLGILATLRGYLKQFGEQYAHIEVVPRIDLLEEDVAEEHKITLYRILQEALTNVARHAKADRVEVGLRSDGEVMTLEVKDNGLGFDPRALEFRDDPLGGLGLKNIRERLEICRGAFFIESGDGGGTHLRVTLPVAVHQTDAPGEGNEPG